MYTNLYTFCSHFINENVSSSKKYKVVYIDTNYLIYVHYHGNLLKYLKYFRYIISKKIKMNHNL